MGAYTLGSASNNVTIDNDGQLTLVGNARCYDMAWLSAESLKVPGEKPADEVAHGFSIAYEFTDGTDDTIVGKIRVPLDADFTVNPNFYVGWSAPVADPGDDSKQVVWQLEYSLHAAGEPMNSATPDTTTTTTVSASTTQHGLVMSPVAVSGGSAGDVCFEFRLKRLGADEDDDLGDDCHVHGVCIKYVRNSLGEAI